MTQKTYDPQTAKFIAVVVENMPRMSADVMQRWIQNPAALKKVLVGLCPSEVTEQKKSPFVTHNFLATLVSERTLKDAINAGKYDWTDDNITEKNFPTNKESFGTKDMSLFHFNKDISSENEVLKMDEAGYRPATLMELLVIGEKYPEIQREFPVVALGSSVKFCGVLLVPVLWLDSDGRSLGLDCWHFDWLSRCRFLAVRK